MDVVEFFSGIGGMRLALTGACDSIENFELNNFKAIDTSELVNQVYRHNFPDEPWQVNIESIKIKDLDGKANIWTMSPPCQPFTTTKDAKQLHSQDPRNKAFTHIMESLEKITDRPKFIFLENVKGFCNSEPHLQWTDTLVRCGYSWRQYLLTPFHFRIPNNRMRFYMVIKRDDDSESQDGFTKDASVIHYDVRACECSHMRTCNINGAPVDTSYLELDKSTLHKLHEMGEDDISGPVDVHDISHYTQDVYDNDTELIVGDRVLKKRWAQGLSFVGKEDRCTFCFTSSYGQSYNRASGSLYHMKCHRGKRIVKEEDMSVQHSNSVRLFSPEELLHLFGFPDSYSYPDEMTTRQKYRAIGQSINVVVVRMLMHSELCHYTSANRNANRLMKKREYTDIESESPTKRIYKDNSSLK